MRKPLIITAAVLGGLVAIGAAILLFLDVNQFRGPIQAQIEKRLNRSVKIGQLGLKIIPLSIRLDDVSVGESPKFPSQAPFVTAKNMYVRVGLAALLRKQVNVEAIRIVQPSVELIRNASGEWNFSTLGGSDSSTSGGGSSSVDIADLTVEDGKLAVTDLQQKKPRVVYDHIDVALRDFSKGKRFQVEAAAHLPGTGKELVKAQVSAATPDPGKGLDLSSAAGDVSLEAVSFSGLQAFLGSAPSQVAKAVLNGKLHFQSEGDVLTGNGNVEVSDPRLKDPARLDFNVRDEPNGLLTVSNAKLKVGALAATGKAQVKTKDTPAIVDAELRTENAPVADLLHLASAFGAASGVDGTGVLSLAAHVTGPANALAYDATGTLRDAKLSLDTLRKPIEIQSAGLKARKDEASLDNLIASVGSSHLRGNVTIRNFDHPDLRFDADIDKLDVNELEQLTTPAPGKPASASGSKPSGSGTIAVGTITYNQLALNNVKATVRMENGVTTLSPVSASVYGGEQTGSIVVDSRQAETAFDIKAKLKSVDANKLLSAVSSVKQIVFGNLSSDIDIHANPRPGQVLGQALNGSVSLQMTDGKLAGVQLLNEMAGMAKFLGYNRKTELVTNILKLAGTFKIQNGVANTDNLQLQFDGGSLGGSGSLGLADQQLRLRVTTILAKELSQRFGGNQIGGFMSTALANSKGELVIPAVVSGTFDKPHFEPDAQRIAKMKLEGLLPTQSDPNSTVSKVQGILGALTGAKPDSGKPADPNAQSQKKPGIFDIIDSVRKKAGQK